MGRRRWGSPYKSNVRSSHAWRLHRQVLAVLREMREDRLCPFMPAASVLAIWSECEVLDRTYKYIAARRGVTRERIRQQAREAWRYMDHPYRGSTVFEHFIFLLRERIYGARPEMEYVDERRHLARRTRSWEDELRTRNTLRCVAYAQAARVRKRKRRGQNEDC